MNIINNVMLVDDHTIVRAGLKLMLEAHDSINVVAEAENGREAISLAWRHRPDVIIMDYSMPDLNGLACTRKIAKILPNAKIIVLTMYDNEEYIMQAIQVIQ